MSKYSYLNLIKRDAKQLAHSQGLKLSAAQEQLAAESGFADFHELTTVANRNSTDPRLMAAALGIGSLGELVEHEGIYQALESEVEDALSGAIAETNAYAFTIEDLEVVEAAYDASTGIVLLKAAFAYTGEQDPDKVYYGSTLYADATIRLQRRGGLWQLCDQDGLEILHYESDVERDYWAEQPANSSK